MALDATRLSSSIFDVLTGDPRNGFCNPLSEAQEDMLRTWCDAIANAVVAEVTANAVVNVSSVSGVTTGGGVSGPGTGTVS